MNEGASTDRLTAVVVDDDPLVRRLVRQTLEQSGIQVLAEAISGPDAIESALRHSPDVVLMDSLMPGMDGVAATRRILEARPEQAVVLLSSVDDEDLAILAVRAGAAGFLTKDLDVTSLPRVLGRVAQGEPAITRRTTMRLIEHLRRTPANGHGLRPVGGPLTEREWEVIDLLADRRTNEQIATELVVSVETVRTHVKHILRKLNVSSRHEAVEKAELLRSIADADRPGA